MAFPTTGMVRSSASAICAKGQEDVVQDDAGLEREMLQGWFPAIFQALCGTCASCFSVPYCVWTFDETPLAP